MSQSVAGKKPIPDNTWRRHIDPPGLWLAMATGSVVLHFLVLWLLNLSGFSLLSQQQNSASSIPVEFIEIAPKAGAKAKSQSKTRSVSRNPSSTTRRVKTTSVPKRVTPQNLTAPVPSTAQDVNTIAFPRTGLVRTSPPETQILPKKSHKKTIGEQKTLHNPILKPETRFPPEIAHNIEPPENSGLQPSPSPKIRHNTPIKRAIAQSPKIPVHKNSKPSPSRQTPVHIDRKILEQQEQPASSPSHIVEPTISASSPDALPLTHQQPEPLPSQQPSLPSGIPRQPGGRVNVGNETLLSQKEGGISSATLEVKSDELKGDVPDNPAKPKLSTIPWECPALNTQSDSQPKDFRVFVLIDNNTGKVTSVNLVRDDVPPAQRTQYQKCAEEVLKGVEFTQATTNGKVSPITQQVLRIKIEHQ